MSDLSDGESFILFAALAINAIAWFRWYRRAFRVFAPDAASSSRWFLLGMPPFFGLVLVVALHSLASSDVKDNPAYLTLFAAVGMATVAGALRITPLIGFDPITDLLERRNQSVLVAIGGVWLAVVVLNIGANIGEGASIVTSLFPLAVNGVLLGLLLAATAGLAGVIRIVTVEPSMVAAVRFCGLALALSLPLARASAGDWISLASTLTDSMHALLAGCLLVVCSWTLEAVWSSTGRKPSEGTLTAGVLPAIAFVAGGAVLARVAI